MMHTLEDILLVLKKKRPPYFKSISKMIYQPVAELLPGKMRITDERTFNLSMKKSLELLW